MVNITLEIALVTVLVAAVWYFSGATWDLRSATVSRSLPTGRVVWQHGDLAMTDSDYTVVESLTSCFDGSCLSSNQPALKACKVASAECVPAWTAAPAGAASLLSTPVGGYPPTIQVLINRMLNDSATRCTSFRRDQIVGNIYSIEKTICVNAQLRLLVYRSTHI